MRHTDIVQRQLDAYNAHDLEAFAACFRDDVRLFRVPADGTPPSAPTTVGTPALRAFYAEHRFSIPTLRAELLGRLAAGDKVIDHERIHGLGEQPVEMLAVYRIEAGLIVDVWFFTA